VRVLFLSDGSGGVEEVGDRKAYARRRREESAAALSALGVAHAEHVGLPDGQLAQRVHEMTAALSRALSDQKPDLVLAPSPLEATADHQAAFAALFHALSPLRPGDPLHAALAGAQFLLYEVNHPGYPDLLVDVSDELDTLARAMAAYPSQQERHDYLAAAVGLRRYRALSLPPTISAAEAYTRLSMADFTTRSASRLVRDLGGAPELVEVREGPLVSVVVRTCERPALLTEALASLAASTYRRVEVVLVVDGGGAAPVPDDYPFPVRRVELQPRRGRAAAANAGVEAASGALLGFLDDDDLVEPEHLATLVGALAAAGVRAAYSDAAVAVYELDGGEAGGWRQVERRLPYSRDFDPDLLLLDNYIPLHTLLAERELWRAAGPFDPALPFFEDWDLLVRMAALAPFHHLPQVTCEYRHFRGGGHVLGERPRERPDFLAMKQRVLERHRERLTPETLARAVDRLRNEAVEAGEAAAAARASALDEAAARAAADRAHAAAERGRDAAERARLAAEETMHRHHGEVVAVRGENEALRAAVGRQTDELQRLYRVEEELRRLIADQDAHLGRCYAEIERLNGLLDEMRATRAWRTHERLQRFRRRR
ncbi:MAG TPA: glycosyltransferase, partial [Thermoanaerobaculia bacterium]|nr:glycosyltransferase [Thermoanaerobaculia bacterium]